MNFITGNGFKECSNFILDEYGFRQNKPINNRTPIFFVKTDYIDVFFNNEFLVPQHKFKLITHNSDHSINSKHIEYIKNPNLELWYAQNVEYEHEKLIPIPIGIANSEWPHGDISILTKIIEENNTKQNIVYSNFNIKTNPKQRKYCLEHIPAKFIENNVDFYTYLKHTAQAYFTICPLGNGIDSHRIWESLYLKTIPIVENTYNISYLIDKHKLPIIKINDWKELYSIDLSHELYHRMVSSFDPNILKIESFL